MKIYFDFQIAFAKGFYRSHKPQVMLVKARLLPYKWLERFCEKSNLLFYGLHTYRHWFASALVNEGVDIVSVSGALGHSAVTTTSNIYCHILESSRAKVSEAITHALKFGA